MLVHYNIKYFIGSEAGEEPRTGYRVGQNLAVSMLSTGTGEAQVDHIPTGYRVVRAPDFRTALGMARAIDARVGHYLSCGPEEAGKALSGISLWVAVHDSILYGTGTPGMKRVLIRKLRTHAVHSTPITLYD